MPFSTAADTPLAVLGAIADARPVYDRAEFPAALANVRAALHVVREPGTGRLGLSFEGTPLPGVAALGESGGGDDGLAGWVGTLPPFYPEWLGDRSFAEAHGVRFPYVAGAMANGIGSTAIVIAMARAGMLGFFGAAGLGLNRIEASVAELNAALPDHPFGCNLIHAPNEPHVEAGTVEIYLKGGVRNVSAAAYMGLTPMVVRYALTGIRRAPDGGIVRKNSLFAKISRPEVALKFLSPAPQAMVDGLVARGELTREEGDLARFVPVAEDITVESDSGGHTDNRPLGALFPLIASVRDACVQKYGYTRPVRVGAAGGLGTPMAVASAFALGAAYVLTGSVNQATVEAGTSPLSKEMLCKADIADVAMAPSADMFEMGVEVQVLKRGTLFAARAHKLREVYRQYRSIDEIPPAERQKIEGDILRMSMADVWSECVGFFERRDPKQLAQAAKDPRHQMALIFRWYLGMASKWAISGEPSRAIDYQIWCGPAQGAFNAWVKGSFLEPGPARGVVQIALNLLEGAAVITRAGQLRSFGVAVPEAAFSFSPRPLSVS